MPAPAEAINFRPAVEIVELNARWMFVWLGVPEQPDAFWEEFTTNLAADLAGEVDVLANAAAVMADATQPIALEPLMDVAALRAEIERMYGAVSNGAQMNIQTGEYRNQKKAGYLQALEEVLALLPKES